MTHHNTFLELEDVFHSDGEIWNDIGLVDGDTFVIKGELGGKTIYTLYAVENLAADDEEPNMVAIWKEWTASARRAQEWGEYL